MWCDITYFICFLALENYFLRIQEGATLDRVYIERPLVQCGGGDTGYSGDRYLLAGMIERLCY